MQQGRQAARNILAMSEGRKPQRFWYFDKGSMATIGRHKAVGRFAPAAPERIAGMDSVALCSYPVFSRIPAIG